MKEDYIILRRVRPQTRNRYFGFGPKKNVEPSVAVNVHKIDAQDASELRKDPDVQAVCRKIPLRLVTPLKVAEPKDTFTDGVAWGVKAVGADQPGGFTGENVVVAVLDTGIDASHAAFSGVDVIEEDFTGDGNGDSDGHGTHCAATIVGREVNGVRIGIAPGVKKLLAGKVLGHDGGTTTGIAQAIEWALAQGAHVISMSLGMDFPGLVAYLINEENLPPELATSQALEEYRQNIRLFDDLASYVQKKGDRGAVLIAAAGNDSKRDTDPKYEIGVSFPAVTDGFISVGALGRGKGGYVVGPFSNTGVITAGPGVDVVSAKIGGGLEPMSGTSMAAPHVAGVAALYAERLMESRQFNPLQITAEVMASGNPDVVAKGYKPLHIGSGMVQAPIRKAQR